jgi:hypothetical protein
MAKAKLGKALALKLKDFIDEMKDKYAMTPDQTKSAIRNYANEGYLPKDPKRILPGDDERLALMISTNTMVPGRKAEFMQDIFEQNVMDDILGEARKEIDLLKLKRLDPTKMTKQADGGRVGMFKGGILKGIASLFKSKGTEVATEGSAKISKIFTDNLVETFGAKEVEEAIRIINNKYKNPELEKLFFKEGESKADDLVNLLEARYMGSTRLQAHPLSFNRRGPGAADRYKKLNETGQRLTDLPGGPGDKAMYGKNFGEMSETTAGVSGRKVYETPPTVFDEGTRLADEGQTIEGVAETMAGMTDESDQILKNMKRMEAETKAMTEIAKAEQVQIGEAVDTFRRMLDDGEDPAAALEFLKNAMKVTKQADGGRVGAKTGGLMALLKAMGMKAPDKIADKKQIENVIRDPKTELERRFTDDPVTGTPATPKDQPTIDEIRDMIQKDPRYNKLTRAQMDMVVRRETIRADFAYNMGIKPEEVGDDIVDLLLMEGYDQRFGFQQGGVANPNLRLKETPEEIEEEKKLLEAQLIDPSYNSATGEYSLGGGLKVGPLEIEAMARGIEGGDPTMQYEGSLDLGNDLMLQGGYYDDAIMLPGMRSPDDEIRLSLTKSFANGGTVPPQKGPMSQGMGTLYRSK